jgi:hypothetical protein
MQTNLMSHTLFAVAVLFSACTGEQGPEGAMGATGEMGEMGEMGEAGTTGPAGTYTASVGIEIDADAKTIGIDEAVVPTLGGNNTFTGSTQFTGEVHRAATGNANLMPVAYGVVVADGTLQANGSTSNVTVTKTGTGAYEVTIANENYYYASYMTVANWSSGTCGTVSHGSVNNKLIIRTFNCAGSATDGIFSFVTYKP